ncbi:MAG: hypothetical protein JWQ21_1625 [Herminiimonas sp.]|nr:hypothetical protein [Herminiimonas sp.]
MAESLNGLAKKMAIQGGLLLMFSITPFVLADSLSDPTRPPASLGFAQEANVVAASGPVLQSVFISPGRKVAIISGQAVNLGEKFGDAQVIKIMESEVTLSRGKDLQTLKLFPGVEKRLISSRTRPQTDIRRQ